MVQRMWMMCINMLRVPYHEQFVSTSQQNQNRSLIKHQEESRRSSFQWPAASACLLSSDCLSGAHCCCFCLAVSDTQRAERVQEQRNGGSCIKQTPDKVSVCFHFYLVHIFMTYFYILFHVCVTVQHKKVIASTIDHFSHGRLRNS